MITSFARFRKNRYQGVSHFTKLKSNYDVGNSIGDDVRGTKLSKLDRFLISEDVIDLLPDIRITALDRIWSDHNPILLHVDKIDFGPSLFKLYNSWLLRDGFDDLIKSEWDSLDSQISGFPIKCHEKFRDLLGNLKRPFGMLVVVTAPGLTDSSMLL
ncbi:RNA-directed DNA polymerase, eukaryota, reverse transcriptase zinc-binding domain protein [Tanacetum coccineum]